MNGVLPVVRYMVVCEDIVFGPGNPNRVTLQGCLWNLRPATNPPYPYLAPIICVFVALADCRGSGTLRLRIFDPAGGGAIYDSGPQPQTFGTNPLIVHGKPFRIRGVQFPHAGLYEVELLFDGTVLATQPLRLL